MFRKHLVQVKSNSIQAEAVSCANAVKSCAMTTDFVINSFSKDLLILPSRFTLHPKQDKTFFDYFHPQAANQFYKGLWQREREEYKACPHLFLLQKRIIKFSFWRECGQSIGLLRSSDPPDVSVSWFKWQGRLRGTPTGPALPGFQRPSDLVAVGCQGGDGTCGSEITCTGHSQSRGPLWQAY